MTSRGLFATSTRFLIEEDRVDLGHGEGVSTNATPAPVQETVLVVEDEVLVRMVISDYLRDCGYKVIEANTADEALAVLQHLDVRVDIVFSDIEMPGAMDGFALSTWVRRNRPGLEVILTGSVPRAANAAAELCDSGPLSKPYEPQAVVGRIRRLMATRARKPSA
jgi:CheY-like chemotaxis protein